MKKIFTLFGLALSIPLSSCSSGAPEFNLEPDDNDTQLHIDAIKLLEDAHTPLFAITSNDKETRIYGVYYGYGDVDDEQSIASEEVVEPYTTNYVRFDLTFKSLTGHIEDYIITCFHEELLEENVEPKTLCTRVSETDEEYATKYDLDSDEVLYIFTESELDEAYNKDETIENDIYVGPRKD